jgi:glycosyltransferase involved in cell wall biosynthesis
MCADRSNFHFHPKAPVQDVPSIMRQHHLLCLPSLGNEMAPLVIQEAGFAGLPVLGAALPAIREWISDGKNGLLFAAGDANSLRLKLQEVLNNPGVLDQLRGNIRPPASFRKTVEHYAALYQSLLA